MLYKQGQATAGRAGSGLEHRRRYRTGKRKDEKGLVIDMTKDLEQQSFRQICEMLPDCIKERLLYLDDFTQSLTQEIRLRAGRPVQLSLGLGRGERFVSRQGKAVESPAWCDGAAISQAEVYQVFRAVCGYSIHTHQQELREGYVFMKGGHRAGICGTAVTEKGQTVGVRDISSINIRVARQVKGVALPFLREYWQDGGKGILLAGPPTSGKTTMIRDMARILSSGFQGRYYKVTVVDERGEIAACSGGQPQNDIGLCCDVLDGYEKGEGMMMALKTLGPEVLICDELGADREIQAVSSALNCGVRVIATIHAGSGEEVRRRKNLSALLDTGAFDRLVLLHSRERAGEIRQVIPLTDLTQG